MKIQTVCLIAGLTLSFMLGNPLDADEKIAVNMPVHITASSVSGEMQKYVNGPAEEVLWMDQGAEGTSETQTTLDSEESGDSQSVPPSESRSMDPSK